MKPFARPREIHLPAPYGLTTQYIIPHFETKTLAKRLAHKGVRLIEVRGTWPQKNMQMFKALGDETRLRILGLLSHGKLCVCDIMAVLKLPQSTVSRHLAYLKNSNWVYGIRRVKWMYYQLATSIFDNCFHNRIILYLAGLREVEADLQILMCHLEKKGKQSCD